jgi:hypothetical protein
MDCALSASINKARMPLTSRPMARLLLLALQLPSAAAPPSPPLVLPRLIFEIGEGFSNSLVASTRDATASGDFVALDAQLANIHSALLPLTLSYTVDVLLYPCHLYNATAPGAAADPLKRLHPGLLRMMAFFEDRKNMGVFLEAYSSGNAICNDPLFHPKHSNFPWF